MVTTNIIDKSALQKKQAPPLLLPPPLTTINVPLGHDLADQLTAELRKLFIATCVEIGQLIIIESQ